jgi:hypothetical protein
MKLAKTLFYLFIFFSLASCGYDDDAAPVDRNVLNAANLAGTYNVVAISANSTETDSSGVVINIVTATVTGSAFNNATITFTEAGVAVSTGTYEQTAVYVVDGITETEISTEPIPISGSFTLLNNELMFPSQPDATVVIQSFRQTGFTLNLSEEVLETDYSFRASGTYRLVRQ